VLAAAGVADRAALDAAGVRDLSRSHATTLVTLTDGRAYVVKRPSDSAGRGLRAELYAYRLASWHPDLAAAVPTPVLLDERRQVVALAAAPAEYLLAARMGPGFPQPALAGAMGSTLARVHVATTGTPCPTAANCGVLLLPDTPEEHRDVGGSAAAGSVAREVAADGGLAPALRAGARVLRPSSLVHGDAKWDNAVLDPGPPARITLFDWELSGIGDPAWDVGSILADTHSLRVRFTAGPSPVRPPVLDEAMTCLLRCYAAGALAAGAAGLTDGDFADRTVLAWTGRMVHLAIECAAAIEDADHPLVTRHLDAARLLAAAREDLALATAAALAAGR
jgi:aminoglycoside phosphotransferase (APT) family kinase protein